MAAVEVKFRRKPGPRPRSDGPWSTAPSPRDLKQRLAADLGELLPADAFAFALPDAGASSCFASGPSTSSGRGISDPSIRRGAGLPAILIVHRGRALGLAISSGNRHLSDEQRAMFPRLRAAGMRIEVARSFGEALAHLREMGLELGARESLAGQVAELFREAKSRRSAP